MHTLDITKSELKALYKVVSKESPRQYANTLYIDTDRIVATDGFRLAYIKLEVPPELVGTKIPASILKTVIQLYPNKPSVPPTLSTTDNTVTFHFHNKVNLEVYQPNIVMPKYSAVLPPTGAEPIASFTEDSKDVTKYVTDNTTTVNKLGVVTLPKINKTLMSKFLVDAVNVGSVTTLNVYADYEPLEIVSGRVVTVLCPTRTG